jgi:hypothetical protein
MRLAWFAVLASLSVAAHHAPAAPAPLPLSAGGPRIVVAFTNAPQGTPAPAGTTGTRYGGDAYRLAQGAQRQARRIGTAYALRELTSWPIEALAMHCVVYEVPDNRDVAQLIARLQKDARVLLAEPLQEFHTLTTPDAAAYNDPLYDLQSNLTTLAVAAAQQHAQGAGITNTATVRSEEALSAAVKRALEASGPYFIVAKVEPDTVRVKGDPHRTYGRFMRECFVDAVRRHPDYPQTRK